MKKDIKNLIIKTGYYDYLKYSRLFKLYEKFFKPQVAIQAKQEELFYLSFLKKCPLIFDIGANDGHKTEAFLKIADQVVCCEPESRNFQILQIRFRNRKKEVKLEQLAMSSKVGKQFMFIHHSGSAFNTLNPKFKAIIEADELERWGEKIKFNQSAYVYTSTLDALIEKYGLPYFIKIDVEGYELEVIKGLSQPVPFISLECLFPEFRRELEEILQHLQTLKTEITFNISLREKLLYKDFVNLQKFQKFLETFKEPHFELIIERKII